MRGAGFACDQCRSTAVDASDVLPDGWLEVVQRQRNPFGEDYQEGTLHFCGWACAERFALLSQPESVS